MVKRKKRSSRSQKSARRDKVRRTSQKSIQTQSRSPSPSFQKSPKTQSQSPSQKSTKTQSRSPSFQKSPKTQSRSPSPSPSTSPSSQKSAKTKSPSPSSHMQYEPKSPSYSPPVSPLNSNSPSDKRVELQIDNEIDNTSSPEIHSLKTSFSLANIKIRNEKFATYKSLIRIFYICT